jgi:CheY-like chemotaxis protein
MAADVMKKKLNILLIEDDYLDVISVQRALKKLRTEHHLHVAHNGSEALTVLMHSGPDKFTPDIILLDLNMPKMNGLEFLEIIKKYYSLSSIKVYVMTTSSEEYDRSAAHKLGISGYILKPLDFEVEARDDSSRAIQQLRAELV